MTKRTYKVDVGDGTTITKSSSRSVSFAVVTLSYTDKGLRDLRKETERGISVRRDHWIPGEDNEEKVAKYEREIEEKEALLETIDSGDFEFEPGWLGTHSRRELAVKRASEFSGTYRTAIVEFDEDGKATV